MSKNQSQKLSKITGSILQRHLLLDKLNCNYLLLAENIRAEKVGIANLNFLRIAESTSNDKNDSSMDFLPSSKVMRKTFKVQKLGEVSFVILISTGWPKKFQILVSENGHKGVMKLIKDGLKVKGHGWKMVLKWSKMLQYGPKMVYNASLWA